MRPATTRRLLGVASIVAATAGCGQSTRSGESRGTDDSGGSGGQAGSGAVSGSGGNAGTASSTGSSVTGGTSGSGGMAGSPAAGSGNSGGAAAVDISGLWAMFHFGDPVGVELVQSGNVLSGQGCCIGVRPTETIDCCGDIVRGSIVNERARFGFSFELGGSYTYAADVTVSADGRRMLGSFSDSPETMAWVPITITEPGAPVVWLTNTNSVLDEVATARTGSYLLALTGAPAGSAYSPDVQYRLRLVGSPVPMVSGDLGPFWAGEMAWQEGEQTLVIGPVPVTDRAFPIGLRLRFEDVVLSAVEAQMPSGDVYLFSATPQ